MRGESSARKQVTALRRLLTLSMTFPWQDGMQADRFEIRPGQANQLKMMSRVEACIYFETNEPIGRPGG
jgi:hypothetical protein